MNLHGIVSGNIGAVNPFVPATFQASTGSTTADDGMRVPTYADPVTVDVQVQALTGKDLMQIDGLNLNGTKRAIYLYGQADGTVRVNQKGGDLITLTDGPNAGVWLVVLVLEQWPDWCKTACALQNGS